MGRREEIESGLPERGDTGEMRALARTFDWQLSALGVRSTWSECLRTTIDIVMSADTPMALYWGEQHVLLYNDAYASLLGVAHPAAFGGPAAVGLRSSWDELEPMISHVFTSRAGHNARSYIANGERGGLVSVDTVYVPIHASDERVIGVLSILTVHRVRAHLAHRGDTGRTPVIRTADEPDKIARGSSTDLDKR